MGFPTSTDYPDAVDGPQVRADNVDIVYDDDFNYRDYQIRQIQAYLGLTSELIGQGVAGKGPGGMVSPIASGAAARAIRLAARNAFAAGYVLSVGDNYDTAYTEKLLLDYLGILWTLGGIDASAMLKVPKTALPAPGVAGRLQWDPVALSLAYDDGVAWNLIGGAAAGGYLDWVCNFSYTEAAAPIQELMGSGVFDGGTVGSMEVYFRASLDPSLSAGSTTVTLFDLGDVGSPPGVPRTVGTLVATTNGLQYLETASPGFTVVDPPAVPGPGEILSTPRLYEICITSAAVVGDTVLVFSCGLDVRSP